MADPTTLLEPSFEEVIAAIEQAVDLPAERRRHLVCSLRQIAKWLDRPTAVIPARFNAVKMALRQLHHARLGVEAKTLANHKSNVRASLRARLEEGHGGGPLREYRDVTPLGWGEQYHARIFVSKESMRLIAEKGSGYIIEDARAAG